MLDGQEEQVAAGVERAHLETSQLQYNDENALSYTVSLAFYSARRYYNIVRKMPAGNGFADLIFLPRPQHMEKPALVIELKWNRDAETAIAQIHDKKYAGALKDYAGEILLVGINYDIHWNPVRIIQRIDRIGSKNKVIQLVNFWPDLTLDEYINLKVRVETRMKISIMTSTGDDDLINPEEKGDLEYRKAQLKRLQEEVVDLEDMTSGISIMDLGLNDFRMDLLAYLKEHKDIDRLPFGIHAVAHGEKPGVIFVLKNVNQKINIKNQNRLFPFYLVYVGMDGEIITNHLQPKDTLDEMRRIAKGKIQSDQRKLESSQDYRSKGNLTFINSAEKAAL